MSSSRMSIWSVLPPRDAECDIFAPEIAKWISIVLGREISDDLLQELSSGDVLCELFIKLCPEIKLGKYHKGATMYLWKRDNVQMFANATVRFGVPKSAMINYSFFESKNLAMIITSILVFVKVLIEKKDPEEIQLPESFINSICSAYLETRVLHKPHTSEENEKMASTSNSTVQSNSTSHAESIQSESTKEDKNIIEANKVVEKMNDIQLTKDEIRQLDELMRSQVNDMLRDIVEERRKTFGMWSDTADEATMPVHSSCDIHEGDSDDSDDSFDEKYLPRSSTSLTGKEKESESLSISLEDGNDNYDEDVMSGNEEEESIAIEEKKEEKGSISIEEKKEEKGSIAIEEKKEEEEKTVETKPDEEIEENDIPRLSEVHSSDDDDDDDDDMLRLSEVHIIHNEDNENVIPHVSEVHISDDEDEEEVIPRLSEVHSSDDEDEEREENKTEVIKINKEEQKKQHEHEQEQEHKEQQEQEQKQKTEEKKENKSSFWWKSTLFTAAVASLIIAKQFQK